MKDLPAARFSTNSFGFCNPILEHCRVLVALHLRSTYAEIASTFSGAIARWPLRTFRSPMSAVAQVLGTIPTMVSLMRSDQSRPGEPVLNRTATLVAITLISAVTTPVVVNATASKAGVAVATPQAAERTCARRIKVVYAGYGEAQATPCTILAH
jgi:hypothetical protein